MVLPPTDSVSLAARHLKDLPTGDRTPLPDGLTAACEVLDRADPDAGVVIVVTDGRANTADGSPAAATEPRRERSVKQPPGRVVNRRSGRWESGRGDERVREEDHGMPTAERVDAVASDQ